MALQFKPEWCVLRPKEVDNIRSSPSGKEWDAAYAYYSAYRYGGVRGAPGYEFRLYRRK